jgi:hypothetical protein
MALAVMPRCAEWMAMMMMMAYSKRQSKLNLKQK